MRGLRKTTTRWLWPAELRAERFAESQAKERYADLLGAEFIAGLEKRSDLLEGRYYKGLAIQIPLFFILALSLLNVDVKAAFLGFSIESAKSIREILLVLSVPVALFIAVIQLRLTSINEMLKNSIARIARDDVDLRDFLDVRYGLSYFVSKPYGRRELGFGYTQLIASLAAMLLVFSLIGLMLIVALIVQIGCIREVYLHPNFSPGISKLVIAVVIGGDIGLLLMAFLNTSIQPYQSWEDWNKLAELADRDPERVKQILQKIVADHASSGSLKRIFGRPKMKRMP